MNNDVLNAWWEAATLLKDIKEKELELRKQLFAEMFPNPTEGINSAEIAEGWALKANYKMNRKVDMAQLSPMRDALTAIGVGIDPLLNWSVALNLPNYRVLPSEARSLFDNIVTTTPGVPSLEIVEVGHKQEPAPNVDVETGEITIQAPVKAARKPRKKKGVA